MKWAEIFDNLRDYDSPLLSVIESNEKKYKTQISYKPTISLGFSFGENNHETRYNPVLAQAIRDAEIHFSKHPVIVQYEVWESLKENGKADDRVYVAGERYELCKKCTKDILEIMMSISDKEGLDNKSPLCFAHPAHIFRVLAISKKLGLEGCPFIRADVQWPSKNTHTSFVRSPVEWAKRELMVRVHHKIHGWI